jgi:predicted RNase H-like HicB family nuclease
MRFNIEIEQEEDGRWIAEIPDLPGVMVYGATREEAQSKVEALALRVIADRIESQGTTAQRVEFVA